jgi:hypothetical protein
MYTILPCTRSCFPAYTQAAHGGQAAPRTVQPTPLALTAEQKVYNL